jgi:hypothetical protein
LLAEGGPADAVNADAVAPVLSRLSPHVPYPLSLKAPAPAVRYVTDACVRRR